LINCYIAVGSGLSGVVNNATKVSESREWLNPQTDDFSFVGLNPGLLIYLNDKPVDLALIADRTRLCRPDLIIESLTELDWANADIIAKINKQHAILKPILGSFVISMTPVPDRASEWLRLEQKSEQNGNAGVVAMETGYDISKLVTIVESIKKVKNLVERQ
jgi:hypothetical protein